MNHIVDMRLTWAVNYLKGIETSGSFCPSYAGSHVVLRRFGSGCMPFFGVVCWTLFVAISNCVPLSFAPVPLMSQSILLGNRLAAFIVSYTVIVMTLLFNKMRFSCFHQRRLQSATKHQRNDQRHEELMQRTPHSVSSERRLRFLTSFWAHVMYPDVSDCRGIPKENYSCFTKDRKFGSYDKKMCPRVKRWTTVVFFTSCFYWLDRPAQHGPGTQIAGGGAMRSQSNYTKPWATPVVNLADYPYQLSSSALISTSMPLRRKLLTVGLYIHWDYTVPIRNSEVWHHFWLSNRLLSQQAVPFFCCLTSVQCSRTSRTTDFWPCVRFTKLYHPWYHILVFRIP